MRLVLQLLTVVSLLFAPLAAPAAAMTVVKHASAECRAMDHATAKFSKLASKHGSGNSCCLAIPSAIDTRPLLIDRIETVDHLRFLPLAEAFRLGAGPAAVDPPPRGA